MPSTLLPATLGVLSAEESGRWAERLFPGLGLRHITSAAERNARVGWKGEVSDIGQFWVSLAEVSIMLASCQAHQRAPACALEQA